MTADILHAAGIPGFLSNIDEARSHFTSEDESHSIQGFIEYWWGQYGNAAVGSKEFLVPEVMGDDTTAGLLDLEGGRKRTPKGIQTRMGNYLQKLLGRVFDLDDGTRCQVYVANGAYRSKVYRLAELDTADPSSNDHLIG